MELTSVHDVLPIQILKMSVLTLDVFIVNPVGPENHGIPGCALRFD
jgi:hypothetical protein